MAHQTIWYYSSMPEEIVDIIEKDLSINYDSSMSESYLYGGEVNKDKRNSKNTWVPSEHWIGGFMWHYITRANRENFLYDLRCIDGESLQYTQYGPGEFYGWHNDAGIASAYKPESVGSRMGGKSEDFINENTELVRKLSFVLQLSPSLVCALTIFSKVLLTCLLFLLFRSMLSQCYKNVTIAR